MKRTGGGGASRGLRIGGFPTRTYRAKGNGQHTELRLGLATSLPIRRDCS